jgi:hypothetical protein
MKDSINYTCTNFLTVEGYIKNSSHINFSLGYGIACAYQQTNQKPSVGAVASGSLTSAVSGSSSKFICYCKWMLEV